MKKKIKVLCICGVVAVIAVIAVILVLAPEKVESDTAELGTIKSSVKGIGTLEAGESIDVKAGVSAKIKSVSFRVGDSVQQDEKLITYDVTKLEEEKTLSEQNLTLKKAELTAAKSNNERNKNNLYSAQNKNTDYETLYQTLMDEINTFNSNEQNRKVSVTELEKNLEKKKAEAQKNADNLQNDLTALQSQLEGKIAYESSNDNYKKLVKEVQEAIESKTCAIDEANAKIADIEKEELALPEKDMTYDEYAVYQELQQSLTDVQRQWDASRSKEQTANSQVLSDNTYLTYEAGISIAETELLDAKRNLDLGNVGEHASGAGVISEKYVSPGSVVSAGDSLYTIKSTDSTKAVIQISKYDYPYVQVGQDAVIKVGNLKYDGKVTKISKISTTDTSGKAKVSVETTISNPDENIVYGLDADVTINTQEKDNCIILPNKMVYSDDSGTFCYIIQDGKITKKNIETGISDNENTEIVSGLSEGDQAISQPMTDDDVEKRARY